MSGETEAPRKLINKVIRMTKEWLMLDAMQGTRNWLGKHAGIQSGERVLVLGTTRSETDVINLVAAVCRELGAEVTISIIEHSDLPHPGPGKIMAEAFKATDVVLRVGHVMCFHDAMTQTALLDYGMRMSALSPPGNMELLASPAARFPLDLFYLLAYKVYQQVRAGSVIRVTDPKGTDITARYTGEDVGGEQWVWDPVRSTVPGDAPGTFPPGVCGLLPEPGSGNGVLLFDGYVGMGRLKEPIKLTIENGWCTRIDGGSEARLLKNITKGVENVMYFTELMWGLNPKTNADIDVKPMALDAERHAGILHAAIGNSTGMGGKVYSKLHLDGLIEWPTVYIDGVELIKDGRLVALEDPEIIEAAREYGDPAKVLADIR